MSDGVRLQELHTLPTHWRVVLQAVMRRSLTYEALFATVSALGDDSRMSRAQLDAVIAELRRRDWLIEEDGGDGLMFRANIARKPGKQLAKRIWDALDDSANTDAEQPLWRGGSRSLPKNLWDDLDKTTPPEDETQTPTKTKLSGDLWEAHDKGETEVDETKSTPKPRKTFWDKLDD